MANSLSPVVLIADRIANPDQIGSVRAFAERLKPKGIEARVICSYWGESSRDGLSVLEIPGICDRWRLAWNLRGLRYDESIAPPLMLHVLQSRMAPVGLELAERWGVPYLQGVEEFQAPGTRMRLSRKWCRGIVATSTGLRDDLVRGFGIPSEVVHVVHRGIARAESVFERRLNDPSRVKLIGAAGAMTHGAGFSTYLNAARRVLDAGIDAEFILVGQGEEEADLRRRADRLRISDRVTFAGDAAVGLSFWDILDVYCQPSLVPTVGRHLARALAHGLPAVASDVEGLRSLVVHNGTGLRVPPGDTNALARAILDVLADRALAVRLGQRGRDVVSHEYDLDREVESLASLYHEIIKTEADDAALATTIPFGTLKQEAAKPR